MSAPVNISTICRLSLNFTTLLSIYTQQFGSKPFPKCCSHQEMFSITENQCVNPATKSVCDRTIYLYDPPKFDNLSISDHKLSCWNFNKKYIETNTSECDRLSFYYFMGNATSPDKADPSYTYCWDMDGNSSNAVFSTGLCSSSETSNVFSVPVYVFWIYIYWISLLLTVTTTIIYLAEPKLRAKTQNKCLIFYLICLTLHQLLNGEDLSISGTHLLAGLIDETVYFMLLLYTGMVSFNWLNVMCIHLWRTLRSVRPKSGRIFYAYALYALVLPVIEHCLMLLDSIFFDEKKLRDRCGNWTFGGIFTNPILIYHWNVIAVQQIINVCIFVRVGYILWRNKKQSNINGDIVGKKNYRRRTNFLCQLLTLFIITGMTATVDFTDTVLVYFNKFRVPPLYLLVLSLFNLFPGFLIFITYICCNKKVRSTLRSRFEYCNTNSQVQT